MRESITRVHGRCLLVRAIMVGGMRAREQVRPGLGHCAVSSAPHGKNKKKETHESKTGVLQLDEGSVELNIIYCVPLRGFCRGVLYSITLYIDYSKSFLR